jgi:hypothetical protein
LVKLWPSSDEPTSFAVAVDERAVRLVAEPEGGEAGHEKGVAESEHNREDEQHDDGW